MHAGLVPQHDFFIYVPLIQKQEASAQSQAYYHKAQEALRKSAEPVLKYWTKVALPGQLTVYTRTCGDEER